MTKNISKVLLLLVFSVIAVCGWALVSDYSFASSVGTFAEISGGTIHGDIPNLDDEDFMAIPIGFDFTYNEQVFDVVSINANGFMAMGPTIISTYLAISSATGSNNVIAAMNRDLLGRDNGELMTLTSGTAPNRVFTVQWKHYRRYATAAANDDWTFQIQLHENMNKVVLAYGSITAVTVSTAQTVQVGLRGDSVADFNNRLTTTDWTATTTGTAANSTCRISATVFPPDGLFFTWTPPQTGTPPMPAQNPVPANNAINVNITTPLSWASGGGAPTGYKVYIGTDNPPTNIVNGTQQTGTSYIFPSALQYSTAYYWQIVPFNDSGDAVGCPVWQFTTLADPTVTTYPYLQNFDATTVPALPIGWTAINANSDAYTWETVTANPNSAPNAARIRYNSTLAMNDWLVSPPMVLDADTMYRISFYYRAGGATYTEKLALYSGSQPTPASMTNQLFINENITNVTYQLSESVFSPSISGPHYFGFHGFSAADMFYIYVDDFMIEEITESWDPPTNLAASVQGFNVHLTWTAPGETPPPPPPMLTENFDSYPDFAFEFAPWTLVDVDLSTTYGITGTTFPGQYSAMAYIIFNPNTTVPPMTATTTHSGAKMAASFASTSAVNNDWMISPLIQVPDATTELAFFAKSYTAQYGLERFKVGVSTGGTAPANFTIISGASYIQAPIDWTEYVYSLAAYAGQNIRIAIQCVSDDAFIFFVDDVEVRSVVGRSGTSIAYNEVLSDNSIRHERITGIPSNPAIVRHPVTREQTGYKVYRDGNLINTITDAAIIAFDDLGLTPGTYSYTVTATYTHGESVPAGPVTAVVHDYLDPPTNLTAEVDGNDVTLSWENPEGPIVGEWLTWDNGTLGNSIGTNAAANFDVAHRFTQADLGAYQGSNITQVRFVPAYQNCVYTVKVWTGGTSATNPGTLVHTQVVNNPILDEWNLVILDTPVPVPSTGELWFGYNVDTQGGYPAGCDSGPALNGMGNLMYWSGAWTTLLALAPTLNYNWSIGAFAQTDTGLKAITPRPVVENRNPVINSGVLGVRQVELSTQRNQERIVTGYKVYRDGVMIAQIGDPSNTTYTDMDLPNGTYVYGVSAVHTVGDSDPVEITVNVDVYVAPAFWEDGFENHADFALSFAPWTTNDVDQQPTYGFSGIDFPNSESPMAYIIFNPSQTTPPMTTNIPHGGAKMAASFAAVTPPNNDWMITPRVSLGTESAIKFYAKSHTSQYGLERMRVGVSTLTNPIPASFQYLTGPSYVEVPTTWTEYVYDLSAYNGMNVWIGIRCVSNDAFVMYIDNFSIHGIGGSVSNEDNTIPVVLTELKGNYPNPFNPETTIRYSVSDNSPVVLEIYNVKGQLVKTLVNEVKASGNHTAVWNGKDNNGSSVSSGVYFYKMKAGKFSSTRKMILMK